MNARLRRGAPATKMPAFQNLEGRGPSESGAAGPAPPSAAMRPHHRFPARHGKPKVAVNEDMAMARYPPDANPSRLRGSFTPIH
jgi:hypothetical protein